MTIQLEVVRDITTQELFIRDWLENLTPSVKDDAKAIMFLVMYS